MKHLINQEIISLEIQQREEFSKHHEYTEDMFQYKLMQEGKTEAIEYCKHLLLSNKTGTLSDDPIRNAKYHFVAATTLATRYAIEGGMQAERAYTTSDVFIRKVDILSDLEHIRNLHFELISYFTREMFKQKILHKYTKPISMCVDYICTHLHEKISVKQLAAYTQNNASYLSALFKKEVGLPITEYITKKRIEDAEHLLQYTTYSYVEISTMLTFSSQSYFTKIFKLHTGLTPQKYRRLNYNNELRFH